MNQESILLILTWKNKDVSFKIKKENTTKHKHSDVYA